jgi:aminopeptidase YwaD
MTRRSRALIVALVPLAFTAACAEPGPAPLASCDLELVQEIDMERAMRHLGVLVEEFGPRVAASPMERQAAEYLAAQLEGFGYQVEVQEFPRVQVVSRIAVLSPARFTLHPATGRVRGVPVSEYPLLTPEDGIQARVVDCGDGDCPADVAGAIALIRQGDSAAGDLLAHAADAGARAAILHGDGWRRHVTAVPAIDAHLPFVTVNGEAGEALREAHGAEVSLRIDRFETSQNVIATRPVGGAPDSPAAPVVIFSAHYDSAEQAPGASDNASGTAGLLELARIYANVETDVELRFAAVGAEEVGLVGSRYYVAQLPAQERDRIVANFNTDMIGTAGEAQSQLFVNTLDGDNLVARSARVARELLALPEEILRAPYQRGASDHVAFHDVGIPAANFIWRDPETTSLEPWYHQPHDRVDRISEERLRTAISVVLVASQQVICDTGALRHELPAEAGSSSDT